jgi:hypothetical protein
MFTTFVILGQAARCASMLATFGHGVELRSSPVFLLSSYITQENNTRKIYSYSIHLEALQKCHLAAFCLSCSTAYAFIETGLLQGSFPSVSRLSLSNNCLRLLDDSSFRIETLHRCHP